MNKKIILVGLVVALASSLFAGDMNCPPQDGSGARCNMKMMNAKNNTKTPFISEVMKLKLSDEQKAKIKELMQQNMEKRASMPKPMDAFGEKTFDKEMFIKISKEKKEQQLENKANMMQSVYNVLDDAQKKELKEILQNKMMKCRTAMKKAA